MIRSFALPFAAITAALMLAQPTLASNMRWLEYSPVRFFTDQDWKLARAATRTALNDTSDGETVTWKNPDNGNHGSVTPVSTQSREGTTCRQLLIKNHARNLDGQGQFDFCQKPDGKWAAVSNMPK